MGLIPTGISIAAAFLADLINPVFIRPRTIGGFIADVTVREVHLDQLRIVDHPVEQGAEITDHAYKRPVRVTITVGYSNSSYQSLGDPNYVQEIYAAFLALQSSREPFDILTGKRAYTSMLAETIRVETDQRSEDTLNMTVDCRQIILVTTQAVTVPNQANMANPASNAGTQTQGTKQLTAAPNYNAAGTP
jgi:hypothetical protein